MEDLSVLFGSCTALEEAGPPRKFHPLSAIYGHDMPNGDPEELDIQLLWALVT